jgi:hypothetical protein
MEGMMSERKGDYATQEPQLEVEEEKHAFFFMTPNLVDDLKLDPCTFRLYSHLKRVAGENGKSFQSADTLAKNCNMSTAQISKSKKILRILGLIRITEKPCGRGKPSHRITIINLWNKTLQNIHDDLKSFLEDKGDPLSSDEIKFYSDLIRSYSDLIGKRDDLIGKPGDMNKTPSKKTPLEIPREEEKEGEKKPPSTRRNLFSIAKALSDVTGMDITKNRGRLFKEAKDYKDEEVEDILQIYGPGGAWYSDDWRGKKGERPKLSDIRETWGKYKPAPVSTKKQVVKSVYHDGQWWMEYVDEP